MNQLSQLKQLSHLNHLNTYHIHLTGQVQGIGFRPFVFRLARFFGINGWVNNSSDGLHVEFNADPETANMILEKLVKESPALARITGQKMHIVAPQNFSDFQIRTSSSSEQPDLLLTPDFALCAECRKELTDSNNRRFGYPFITCTHCGPRYSIINTLPYDRATTSMEKFIVCNTCSSEYNDPENRRYYSQTNSCKDCGIRLFLHPSDKTFEPDDYRTLLQTISEKLEEGKIVAIKGIGGFLLCCDARNALVVERLRKLKKRPTKPLAIMFPGIRSLKQYARITANEEASLLSPVSPIVLVKADKTSELAFDQIAPDLKQIGAMIPYAPLFELVLQQFGHPVVATSANISSSPIIFRDESSVEKLMEMADLILTHNREIYTPQDDSVLRFTAGSNRKIILRRSRGLAPSFFGYQVKGDARVLSTGAMMKSNFGLINEGKVFISQYLGNTDTLEAQESYRHTLTHLLSTLKYLPTHLLSDQHSGYFSHQLALELAEKYQCGFTMIQHHKAHFAAVLAENDLFEPPGSVLGIIWDGTGAGEDGHIWGGDAFLYNNKQMHRLFQFDYFPVLLGDKMAREPRLSALSICHDLEGIPELIAHHFTASEWKLYNAMLTKDPPIQTCSAGRIFDAVAALLGICPKQNHEGEAASLLESLAISYTDENGLDVEPYQVSITAKSTIPIKTLFQHIIRDLGDKKAPAFIAARFHSTLVFLVRQMANIAGVRRLAFSGGVFQNALLTDMLDHFLTPGLELYFHHQLPPNDENISFGQLVYFDRQIS